MFKAQIFVIYCNPNDPETEKQVLKAAIKAKRDFPTNLKSAEDGEFIIDKDKDILFVISKSSNLMFYQFNDQVQAPQGLLMPFGDTFNSMKTLLPKLKKFDDLTVEEWIH